MTIQCNICNVSSSATINFYLHLTNIKANVVFRIAKNALNESKSHRNVGSHVIQISNFIQVLQENIGKNSGKFIYHLFLLYPNNV